MLDPEIIEQIEMVLEFEETTIELAHRQQLIQALYDEYKRLIQLQSTDL